MVWFYFNAQIQHHRSGNNVFSLQTNDVHEIIHRVHNLFIINRCAIWKLHNCRNKIFFRPTKTLEQIQLPFPGWFTHPIKSHHSMNKTCILQVKTVATDPVQDSLNFFYRERRKCGEKIKPATWCSCLELQGPYKHKVCENVRAISKDKHLYLC